MQPVTIVGAAGRMGHALLRGILESDDLTVAGAIDRTDCPQCGRDVGALVGLPEVGLNLTSDLQPRRGQVVVDFSLPEATGSNIARCVDAGVPLVLGTTGLTKDDIGLIHGAAEKIPVVFAANYSVGVTLLTQLAGLAAKALGPDWDAEMVEIHHKHKRDAPSGTALRIGIAVAEATGRDLEKDGVFDRSPRNEPRRSNEIGIVALRGGDSVGEHTLMFLTDGERIELSHRARDRQIFARGALRAARWVADKPPGLYDMPDVLGLSES